MFKFNSMHFEKKAFKYQWFCYSLSPLIKRLEVRRSVDYNTLKYDECSS